MINSYFARQYHEINSYLAALRHLMNSLPEDVKEDLLANTSLGEIPLDLDDVEAFLEENYPPYPKTRRFTEEKPNSSKSMLPPLLRAVGFNVGDF